MKEEEQETVTVIEDPTTAGLVLAFKAAGLNVDITPFRDDVKKRTFFKATGDVKSALERIAVNDLIGSRTVLESIKNCRSMIWLFKEGR